MSACSARGRNDRLCPGIFREAIAPQAAPPRIRAAQLALALVIAAGPLCATAATIVVQPGQSIAAAVQAAQPGDTISVQPGVFHEGSPGDLNALTITKDGITISGAGSSGNPVILENAGGQSYGVWVSPSDSTGATAQAHDENPPCATSGASIHQFTLTGITVRGFPTHGVHLACVNGFTLNNNVSDSNGVYGLFPIVSQHGVMSGNEVTNTTHDAAVYVGQSDDVAISNNNVHDSLLGIEVQDSRTCSVTGNNVHDNTLGILVDVEGGDKHIKNQQSTSVSANNVHDNNRANTADADSIIAVLPPGIGILLVGADTSDVKQNTVQSNKFAGIAVVSLCLGLQLEGQGCVGLDVDPNSDGNRIEKIGRAHV